MKCAVIIVYDGNIPSALAQKAAAAAIAEYGYMHNTENVSVYTMDEPSILAALINRTIPTSQPEKQLDEESSVEIVFEVAKEPLAQKNLSEFGTILLNALMDKNNPALIHAVEILSKDGAENRVSTKTRRQYYMTPQVFETIRLIHNICQGRRIIFQ